MGDWIDVNDRLPEDGEYIAVWIAPHGELNKSFWTNSTFWGGNFEVKGFHHNYQQVSHWMKISPPDSK